MIKYLLLLALSTQALAASPAKVSHIKGVINQEAVQTYYEETKATLDLPGDRTVYIDSLGGALDSGQTIIDMMEAEKSHGVKIVCIVNTEATSMAFNVLTHCDRRYAKRTTRFLVHKAALGGWDPNLRLTVKNLRTEANEIDRVDEVYRRDNARAMHMSLSEYDNNADEERTWSAAEMLKMGYLSGYAR